MTGSVFVTEPVFWEIKGSVYVVGCNARAASFPPPHPASSFLMSPIFSSHFLIDTNTKKRSHNPRNNTTSSYHEKEAKVIR